MRKIKKIISYTQNSTAVEHLKHNKAYKVDEIPAELLKYTDEDIKKKLYNICNEKYIKVKTISDFEKIIVVLIPKKKRTEKCREYRTFHFTTHTTNHHVNNQE